MMPKQHRSVKYQSKVTQEEPEASTKKHSKYTPEQKFHLKDCLPEVTEGQGNPVRKRLMMDIWGTY